MIAPEPKRNDACTLGREAKNFICFNYGDSMWKDLEGEFTEAENLHNTLNNVNGFISNSE